MKKALSLARNWVPPIVVRWLNQMRGGGISFDGDFDTWDNAAAQCSGYDSDEIREKVLAATIKVKSGEAAFERDSVTFEQMEYVWPLLSALMWAAARDFGKLNVLDFGGALGSTYFQNRKFLNALPEVRWNVVEQARYVEAGTANIQDEQLRFYHSIEQCLRQTRPNVILLSGVLQYLESPFDIIASVSEIGARTLIIDRTPFAKNSDRKFVIQRVPASIYAASYPMHVFSHPEFMNALDPSWGIVASHLCPEGFVRSTSGIEFSFQGMLMQSQS